MKDKIKHILKNLDAYFAGFMFLITLAIVVVNVFLRYCFNYMIPWSEEVATSCFVYTTFVGVAWCLRTKQHVGVDLIVEKLPDGVQKIIKIITDAIIAVVNCYITYLSVRFIYSSRYKTMPILKVSSIYLNMALFLGFGLMAVYSLRFLFKDIQNIRKDTVKETAK